MSVDHRLSKLEQHFCFFEKIMHLFLDFSVSELVLNFKFILAVDFWHKSSIACSPVLLEESISKSSAYPRHPTKNPPI